ncbi:MAG: pyridoxamine 5'-phosphate oxidase [Pseudomonadota bacterium]
MEISPLQDPIELFGEWMKAASQSELNDPDAAALATVGKDGQPSVRMILFRNVDKKGFYFYTNMKSRKGRELTDNPRAAICFHWKSLLRQVRVEGKVESVPAPIVDAYFKTRYLLNRLSAWASRQSEPLSSRNELEDRVREYELKFQGQEVPLPPHWVGYCVVPEKIEFWEQSKGRLHDRFLFTKTGHDWSMCRLNP